MKEDKKRAKKLMQEQSLPYNAWSGNHKSHRQLLLCMAFFVLTFKFVP